MHKLHSFQAYRILPSTPRFVRQFVCKCGLNPQESVLGKPLSDIARNSIRVGHISLRNRLGRTRIEVKLKEFKSLALWEAVSHSP